MCVDQDLWQLQLFFPNTTVTKCNTLACFFKRYYQNPQSDFFRVWTSFMCVDRDLWQLQLFLPNTTVKKCNTLVRFFKSCYQNPETDFFRVGTSFLCVDKELWQLQLFLPNTTVKKCYTLACFFKSCYQNPQTDSDFNVTFNWTKDLHPKFSCFCLMPLYKQVTFMLCRGSLFQQLLNYFANFVFWTKFTNRNCCLQNSVFFCSLFCQSKQKNSWTSFSSVPSIIENKQLKSFE